MHDDDAFIGEFVLNPANVEWEMEIQTDGLSDKLGSKMMALKLIADVCITEIYVKPDTQATVNRLT